jgi:hypothetical protein
VMYCVTVSLLPETVTVFDCPWPAPPKFSEFPPCRLLPNRPILGVAVTIAESVLELPALSLAMTTTVNSSALA